MYKVFISQRMRGRTDEEILKERTRIKEELISLYKEEVEIIDSFLTEDRDNPPLWYLGRSLELMAEADTVYFAKGWKGARGCRIEYLSACEYNYKIIDEELV